MKGPQLSANEITINSEENLPIPTDAEYALMSYADLAGHGGFRVAGLTLVGKEELLGVPHIITRVTFWQPLAGQLGMVSVEATVGGNAELDRAILRNWIPNVTSREQLRIDPNERVVYNDGSTGVRRQLVKILTELGLVELGQGADASDPARFDQPWPEWDSFAEGRYQSAAVAHVPSFSRYTDKNGAEKPFVLLVDRGLSVSEYTNEYTNEGLTYYLR